MVGGNQKPKHTSQYCVAGIWCSVCDYTFIYTPNIFILPTQAIFYQVFMSCL